MKPSEYAQEQAVEIYMPPKEVMTIQQIRDAYSSNDYNAELLLKHLMIRTAELEEGLKEQRLETDAWRGTARDKGASSRSAAAERDALKARIAELEAQRNRVFEFLMSADGNEEIRMTALHMLNR